jgi:hypothetical protein
MTLLPDLSHYQLVLLMALVNLAVCLGIVAICGCRVAITSKATTRRLTRAAYTALLVAAVASAGSPLVGDWPGWSVIFLAVGVLLHLMAGVRAWRSGLPLFDRSDAAPLDALPPTPENQNNDHH